MMRRWACGIVASLGVVVIAERTPMWAAGTAALSGTVVVDGESATRGVRHALVTIAFGGGTLAAATDDDGRFAFANLPSGRFTLTAEKPGFVKAYYGSKRAGQPPGMPIALADDQKITGVRVALVRGAVITGAVRDEVGNPAAGAQVQLVQAVFENGGRRFIDPPGPQQLATSDDQGTYRLYGLAPGEYAVRARGPNPGGEVIQVTAAAVDELLREAQGAKPTPAVAAPPDPPLMGQVTGWSIAAPSPEQAQTVTLSAGEERAGVDVVLAWRTIARVSGIAIGPSGQPISNVMVGVANLDAGALYNSPGALRPDAEGRFSLSLGPGRWLLFGRGSEAPSDTPGALPFVTETEFTVSGDRIDNLVMSFERGVTVSGRVVFDGKAAPMRLDVLRVSLVPVPIVPGASMAPSPASVAVDGTFTCVGVGAGRYRPSIAVASPWSLRSAMAGNRDVLDTPLDVGADPVGNLTIHLTDTPTQVSGRLFDALGRPAPEYSIVLFPTDRALWTSAPRRSSGAVKLATDGSYHVTGLPPGEYFMTAVTDASPNDLTNPTFLEDLASAAVRITLAEGEHKTQDFKLGGG